MRARNRLQGSKARSRRGGGTPVFRVRDDGPLMQKVIGFMFYSRAEPGTCQWIVGKRSQGWPNPPGLGRQKNPDAIFQVAGHQQGPCPTAQGMPRPALWTWPWTSRLTGCPTPHCRTPRHAAQFTSRDGDCKRLTLYPSSLCGDSGPPSGQVPVPLCELPEARRGPAGGAPHCLLRRYPLPKPVQQGTLLKKEVATEEARLQFLKTEG